MLDGETSRSFEYDFLERLTGSPEPDEVDGPMGTGPDGLVGPQLPRWHSGVGALPVVAHAQVGEGVELQVCVQE